MSPFEDDWPIVFSRCADIASAYWKSSSGKRQTPPEQAFGGETLPSDGLGVAGALDEFSARVLPYLSPTLGPRFFGFAVGGITPASLAGDWLASATDQLPRPHGRSIATQLTEQTIRYLTDLFGLPRGVFGGVLVSGTSVANLIALTTARQWCAESRGLDVTWDGVAGLDGIGVYAAHPHVSVVKALGIIGLGRKAWRPVASLPGREAIDPLALDQALATAGPGRGIVVASAGTVTSGDFDGLQALAESCRRHGAWLHVDGAFGLFARCHPAKQSLLDGLEQADSIAVDMHKWLNVPYDCGLLLCRHTQLLERAHGGSASYFLEPEPGLPDYARRGIELSTRCRALPVWMTLTAYGRTGVAAMIEKNCTFAERLGEWIARSGLYALLAPVRLNIVLFRGLFAAGLEDEGNEQLIAAINQSGELFCSPGRLGKLRGVRLAVCNWRTGDADFAIAVDVLSQCHPAARPARNEGMQNSAGVAPSPVNLTLHS